MKYIFKILIISTLSIFSCQKDVKDLIDKTAVSETPPVHTPDSPMWKQLASPSKTRYIDGVFSTEKEDLYNCVMARRDTISDHLEIDNVNTINMFGSIDAQTTMNGTYYPEYNGWFVQKTDANHCHRHTQNNGRIGIADKYLKFIIRRALILIQIFKYLIIKTLCVK